jgi:hypothetical protein
VIGQRAHSTARRRPDSAQFAPIGLAPGGRRASIIACVQGRPRAPPSPHTRESVVAGRLRVRLAQPRRSNGPRRAHSAPGQGRRAAMWRSRFCRRPRDELPGRSLRCGGQVSVSAPPTGRACQLSATSSSSASSVSDTSAISSTATVSANSHRRWWRACHAAMQAPASRSDRAVSCRPSAPSRSLRPRARSRRRCGIVKNVPALPPAASWPNTPPAISKCRSTMKWTTSCGSHASYPGPAGMWRTSPLPRSASIE